MEVGVHPLTSGQYLVGQPANRGKVGVVYYSLGKAKWREDQPGQIHPALLFWQVSVVEIVYNVHMMLSTLRLYRHPMVTTRF